MNSDEEFAGADRAGISKRQGNGCCNPVAIAGSRVCSADQKSGHVTARATSDRLVEVFSRASV